MCAASEVSTAETTSVAAAEVSSSAAETAALLVLELEGLLPFELLVDIAGKLVFYYMVGWFFIANDIDFVAVDNSQTSFRTIVQIAQIFERDIHKLCADTIYRHYIGAG